MSDTAGARSANARRRGFGWRRWNNILHRDIGYLTAALTLVYAVSGVAVNHAHQWNPSTRIEHETVRFAPLVGTPTREAVIAHLRAQLDLPQPKESFRPERTRMQLFFDGWNVEADLAAGEAQVERFSRRAVLGDLNFLHLNQPKGLWTYVADLYAVALFFLAVSGLFVLKGKKGITGRGKWLFSLGLAIPVSFLLVLRYLA